MGIIVPLVVLQLRWHKLCIIINGPSRQLRLYQVILQKFLGFQCQNNLLLRLIGTIFVVNIVYMVMATATKNQMRYLRLCGFAVHLLRWSISQVAAVLVVIQQL